MQKEILLLNEDCKVEEIQTRDYNVKVVNSLKKKYPHLRQRSKVP